MTTAQEEILEKIIEAYQNGKRLSDLPDVQGTNPYNLLVEVLDEDGESKKAALASLLPYMEDECSFGVEFDTTVSSPTCTRIGSTDLHKSLPVQSRMKGCLLDDNGKVVEYLNPTDWTSNVRDGSRGQVMVEIPMHYRKFETDGTKRRVRISELPLAGYHCVPKMYVSAYQATVDRTTSTLKLASVANTTAAFRGGNNNANYDGTYRTFLGLPATQISRTNFRTYARNRNAKATSEWNCMTYDAQKALYWLFVVEYATLNSQASFNAQLTSEGFHQGGLGNGVTDWDWTNWGNYNGDYPLIACGCTDSLGNTTGVVSQTVANDDETIKHTFSVPRYRGIENPFGHIWQWTDGINVRVGASEENGGTGLSEVFVCSDPSKFNDSNYDGYSHVGNEERVGGYIKEMIFGEYGEIMPLLAGGGSTTYFCDNHSINIPSSGSALRGVLFGGAAHCGANAGFVYSNTDYAPSDALTHFGSRLCFHPSNE
jgi:hypothetical protein